MKPTFPSACLLSLGVWTAACAAHVEGGQRVTVGRPIVEIDRARYDGDWVFLRMLVGAKGGTVSLDRRMIPNAGSYLRNVKQCEAASPLPVLVDDSFPPPPKSSDLVNLLPGEWWGRDLRFSIAMFATNEKGKIDLASGPRCIEAQVFLRDASGNPSDPIPLRVEAVPP